MKTGLLASAAMAAGLLAAPAAFAQPAAYDWTGFYIGLNAGGAWGNSDLNSHVDPSTNTYFAPSSITSVNSNGHGSISPSGFTGGVQGGYNWQSGPLVLGVETDFQAVDISQNGSKTVVYPCCAPESYTMTHGVSANWLWTLRPRVGWQGDGWLIYGTGGLAVADFGSRQHFSDTAGATETANTSSTRTGWTLGGGVERALGGGWSVRGEYLYVGFQGVSSNGTLTWPGGPETASFRNSAQLNLNILRAGVNFKF